VSSAAQAARTYHVRKLRKKREGEVPVPQLYHEIDEGYRHFLARRMKAGALGIRLIDLKKDDSPSRHRDTKRRRAR
jgi:hypothetical protein